MNWGMRTIVLLLLIAIVFPLLATPASAALVPCGTSETKSQCTVCDFFLLVQNIFTFLTTQLAPPIAIAMIIIGGVVVMTAAGSERLKTGKTIITNALIGFGIVLMSWIVVNTIINIIFKVDSPFPWNKVTC